MTNTNTITISNTAIDTIQNDVRRMTARIKLMIQNGKRLNDDEAMALAQYAVATQLDPFCGQCYYIPGVGPVPGVAGYRAKADEQIEYEARRAAEPLGRWWIEYTEADPSEARHDPTGDIAVKAILHDTLSKSAWERRILGAYIECVKGGIAGDGAMEIARQIVGSEPTWSAIGIVFAEEKFSYDNKPEKMSRYERACKRAEKSAIKKRFPRVHLPEPPGGFDEPVVEAPQVSEPKQTEAELLAGLGYGASQPPEPQDTRDC